jgi:hypothetical protein
VTIWQAKPGPWWTAKRAIHAWVGFAVPTGAWFIARVVAGMSAAGDPASRAKAIAAAGYSALGWASVVVLVGGCAWEMATPLTAKFFGWKHPRGDVADLVAFVAGWLVAAIVCVAR